MSPILASSFRPGAHKWLCGETSLHPRVARMWLPIGFHFLDVKPRTWVFVVSDRGGLLLIFTTAWRGCVSGTRAHERLWLADGYVASSSESMLILRPCSACKAVWLCPFTRATPWSGSVKTQPCLTSFSVAPQRRGHKVARVLAASGAHRVQKPWYDFF